ncbi:hypothetical protein [Algoriphagus sp.]|uniref:hypothetical protein n=1 Tax=Algoriphagus sp. TaxID=1872435 RepID=UPI002720E605|nr:hypothetical protein [Algoriphagus sp.]MDO8969035.1 hypothetical protein [Algoriphagus sp.]MDP3198348.1 hypothetical protein [Algoriphagus sp.]
MKNTLYWVFFNLPHPNSRYSGQALFPIRYATRDWLTWRGSLRSGQIVHWGPSYLKKDVVSLIGFDSVFFTIR